MKNVKLKNITATNFKSITADVNFNDEKTLITGRNGCGKTTIFKAFVWLLTGRTDPFTPKNHELYDNREPITRDTPPAKVSGIIEIDGRPHYLSRSAKPKFKRPKGQAEWVKDSSDEYTYNIDGMDLTATEYAAWITHNICDSELLPYCINGAFFSELADSDRQKAGKVLYDLTKKAAGEVLSDSDVPLEEQKAVLRTRIRSLNNETQTLPAQIMSCSEMLKSFCEHSHDDEEGVCPTCGRKIHRKKEKESVKSFEVVKEEAQAQIYSMQTRLRQAGIELAEAESSLIVVEKALQKQADEMSSYINGKLEYTSIQMFDTLKNGETKPSCTIMSKAGVKYSTLNFSARIFTDVELSRLFCRLLDVNLPCFVDECSVFDSKHLPVIDGTQMIYMRCSDDQKLVVL